MSEVESLPAKQNSPLLVASLAGILSILIPFLADHAYSRYSGTPSAFAGEIGLGNAVLPVLLLIFWPVFNLLYVLPMAGWFSKKNNFSTWPQVLIVAALTPLPLCILVMIFFYRPNLDSLFVFLKILGIGVFYPVFVAACGAALAFGANEKMTAQ